MIAVLTHEVAGSHQVGQHLTGDGHRRTRIAGAEDAVAVRAQALGEPIGLLGGPEPSAGA